MEMMDITNIKKEIIEEDVGENIPNCDQLLSIHNKVSSVSAAKKTDLRSLRNFKFRVPPLSHIKTEKMCIKTEQPETAISERDSTITPGCSTSGIGNSQSNDSLTIKVEQAHHPDEVEEIDTKLINNLPLNCQIEEPFSCCHCVFTTTCEEVYNKHLAVHYMEKPFSCERCPFITKHRGTLKSHMLTHIQIKRFSCEFCAFKTCYKGSLKTHMQIHTGDKHFNCEYCTFKTNYKKHHDLHMLSHTGEKSFFCDYCPYKTRKKGKFRDHVLSHSESFTCQLCLYKTSNKSLLSSHMLKCCVLIRPRRRQPLE